MTEEKHIRRLPRKLKKEIKQIRFPTYKRISFLGYLLMYYFIKRNAYIAAIEQKTSLKNVNWNISNGKEINVVDDEGKELVFETQI